MSSLDVPRYFTSIAGLGRLVDYYPIQHQKLNRLGTLLLSMICFLGAGVTLVIGLLETYDRYYKNGPAVILRSISLPAAGAFILILVGVISALGAYRSRNKGAAVYERGFAYSDLKGISAWRWEDITSIQIEIIRRRISETIGSTDHIYALTNTKGERVVLDGSLTRIEQLGTIIRDKVTPLLLNRFAAAFQRGQPVHFGPVTLSRSGGLQIGKHAYAWDQFSSAVVKQGTLQFKFKQGEPASMLASEVPNLEVLLSILELVPI